jgi:hypothetical protein
VGKTSEVTLITVRRQIPLRQSSFFWKRVPRYASWRLRSAALGRPAIAPIAERGMLDPFPVHANQITAFKTSASAMSACAKFWRFDFLAGLVLRFARLQVIRGNPWQNSLERCQIRRLLENIHRNRRGIELVHGRDPQQHFDSSSHADRVVKFVDERTLSIVRADRQGDGAVRIDVIGTELGVIFDDEDSRVFPISLGDTACTSRPTA